MFDYSAADFSADRYHQQLAETRQGGWLAKSPLAYIVLDHDAGEFFLRSRKTAFPGRQLAEFFGVTSGPLAEHIDTNILNLGGEQHRRLRALVGPALTPRAADRWRPVMRGFLEQLWAQPAAHGGCDFVAAVARPYPSLTIATVLGAPHQHAEQLHTWSSWVQRQFDIRALKMNRDNIERAVAEVRDYVTGLLEAKRAAPGDDLISDLLAARDQGDRLSADECVQLVTNLLAGGIDTTTGQLAHAIRLFAARPGQWALLAAEP
ncbi:MAG: cytochrome P450, partial [Streptosporangiaceae bacterium]